MAATGKGGKPGDWPCPACNNNNFANRTVCNRCAGPKPPPPGANVKEGDWLCPCCSNHNFANRQACNKCGTTKPGMGGYMYMGDYMGGYGSYGSYDAYGGYDRSRSNGMNMGQLSTVGTHTGGKGGKSQGNMRPGDWSCMQCGNHNFASRECCNKCAAPNMYGRQSAHYGTSKGGGMMGQSANSYMMQASNMRQGDWMCPGCNNHNFASRESCKRCERSKHLPPNFREGDWMCPHCKNHNFAVKTACNKCQAPRSV